jgi:hypothetical protein
LSVEIILFISLVIIPLYYSHLAAFFLREIYQVQIKEATSATNISHDIVTNQLINSLTLMQNRFSVEELTCGNGLLFRMAGYSSPFSI